MPETPDPTAPPIPCAKIPAFMGQPGDMVWNPDRQWFDAFGIPAPDEQDEPVVIASVTHEAEDWNRRKRAATAMENRI